jgi:hypothetical protein
MALLTAVNQTKYTPDLSILNVTGTTVDYAWSAMPGSQPLTGNNTVFIWQTAQQMIPSYPPVQPSRAVSSNNEDGSDQFSGLQITNEAYLIGYGVGPDIANICMLAAIPAGATSSNDAVSVLPDLTVTVVGSTSISYSYTMPDGTRPGSDGDWVGLWKGQSESSLWTTPPTWSRQVTSTEPAGNGSFTNVQVLRGTKYTLGYFKGGWSATTKPKQSTLACSSTIDN